ncbi:triose-phosphate isomerase [Sediminivirga luteola]|uniref:Triosephosphate isomerase n=1 Tax=Sediminivirga luteola TaxID=1774748 RepID=A0A8J2U194_9MICO|nr:triose-phosphate isomerase [Sediminivirga luteola]GGA28372.1 triosephosphate isomerase [Sediminivirga luteola]
MSRTPLIAGNWKMNKDHLEAIALVQKLGWALADLKWEPEQVEVAVIPPFTDLRSVQTLVAGDKLQLVYGAQDLSAHDAGAYTGEVSGAFLARLECSYVLVGHSERREYHGEDDALLAAKLAAAYRHGLTPVLCVGEALEARQAGEHETVTLAQLEGAMKDVPAAQVAQTVIAYEPVWAIGTGEVASPEDAGAMATTIRRWLAGRYDARTADAVRVLYGGSVKSGTIAEIMAQADVDGGLVGGASLDPQEFAKLVVNAKTA